ncbi:hypothetical protein ILUMI_12194 [Ignelater luminosus]|uniref:Uncharacterized protein n=1 Tax=Ignelater luminosus TaxID=2038154 RepID=A0A8K0D0S0_IGNLU|nr:hypothetical protein ILUMI_12194 [Ignelater luminosus]
MPSTALAINSYFQKRLTLAMSYSVTGVGLLPIVMPQICHFLLNIYGTKGTVLILAAISYHALIGVLLLRPLKKNYPNNLSSSRKAIQLERYNGKDSGAAKLLPPQIPSSVYNETTTPITKNVEKQGTFSKLFTLLNLELFKERAYVIIIVGMGISYVAELNFTLMTPFVLTELSGFSRADVALAMSIQAAADISGRLFIPILSHRSGWSPKLMYAASLTGSSLGRTILAIFCDTRNIVLSCSVLLGLSKGAKAVFQSLILPKYVSLEKLPSAMGFLMVINGILSLAIGPIIGAVHDLTKSYAYALHTATTMSIFCIILWLIDAYEFKISNKSSLDNLEQAENNSYVNTKNNPADIATRGLLPNLIVHCDLWWFGSEFLKSNSNEWLASSDNNSITATYLAILNNLDLFNRFSNLIKLKRIVAYCLGFSHNLKCSKEQRQLGQFTVEELVEASKVLTKICQTETFSNELQLLSNHKTLPKHNKLISLAPFVDEYGILRVGGRLHHSHLGLNSKHSILLDGRHLFT